jgi:hypothetical protein
MTSLIYRLRSRDLSDPSTRLVYTPSRMRMGIKILLLIAGLILMLVALNACAHAPTATPTITQQQADEINTKLDALAKASSTTTGVVAAVSPPSAPAAKKADAAVQVVIPAVQGTVNALPTSPNPAVTIIGGVGDAAQKTAPLLPDPIKEYVMLGGVLLTALASILSSHKTTQKVLDSASPPSPPTGVTAPIVTTSPTPVP